MKLKKSALLIGTLLISVCCFTACGNNNQDYERISALENKIAEIEDKEEIRKLVDSFSILADQKDAQTQAQLFTEDAVVTIINGDRTMELKGREEIGSTFGNTLASYNVVYHINGQLQVEINGDTATGTAYCQAVLADRTDGTSHQISHEGVYYEDEYVKENGKWLIKNRKSTFSWVDAHDLPQE